MREPLVQLTNQAAYDAIQEILEMLPDERSRECVLFALSVKRCKRCFVYDPSEQFQCCPGNEGARS